MNDNEKRIVRNFIAEKHPFHLNGYDKGWLFFKEIKYYNHKFIHIFSKENGIKEILGTVVI